MIKDIKRYRRILKILKQIMTTLANITPYVTRFVAYPADFVEFAEVNHLTLLSLSSLRGQALALMAQPELRGQKHLTRDEAVKFFQQIGMETTDAIQQFNKETGFKRMKMKGNYCLKYPFEADTTHLVKRKGATIRGDRDEQINAQKAWWKENLLDVPNDQWEIGHLDPTIDDASEKNLAYQPPIQGKYRDRFKFDAYFLKMWPTADELTPKMDEYYTEKEQRRMYEALKKKFETGPVLGTPF